MEKQKSGNANHLLIRYSDIRAPIAGTIDEHLKVLHKCGYVWFGKFGRRIGIAIKDKLDKQIRHKVESLLFLVGNKDTEYIYISKILEVRYSIDRRETQQVPEYYRDKVKLARTWLKIGKTWRAKRSTLGQIYTNFGFPVSEVLGQTMTGHLIVRTRVGFTLKNIEAVEV